MLLIIGYGNTLRSDDGVGPRVAEAIEASGIKGVRTIVSDLLTPELAEPVAESETVVFVDAALDDSREVQLRPLQAADSSQLMAHAADPRTLLAVARDVYGRVPRAWWLTIPISNIAIGETLSPVAQRGLQAAVKKIRELAAAP